MMTSESRIGKKQKVVEVPPEIRPGSSQVQVSSHTAWDNLLSISTLASWALNMPLYKIMLPLCIEIYFGRVRNIVSYF
jgi:hypothetical protein